ncbi:hypothetical protein H2O64_11815 [Kordia sp. YSTF-M3]|uniref:Bacteriocin n=1 Tax=Kordia aestuariivivens TaxID=2759037 RepID=A0ABR7Q9X3_9FLAO|nr:hypothetical protein [Kordia aestuariivivens]MBC8755366.1 hypothetical protein [Kordia aestuariivivens]
MKKRNLNSLALKKTTISNFLIGGMVDSDNACPSAVSCESVCFCIPPGGIIIGSPSPDPLNCEPQANSVQANPLPASPAGDYANAAG